MIIKGFLQLKEKMENLKQRLTILVPDLDRRTGQREVPSASRVDGCNPELILHILTKSRNIEAAV